MELNNIKTGRGRARSNGWRKGKRAKLFPDTLLIAAGCLLVGCEITILTKAAFLPGQKIQN